VAEEHRSVSWWIRTRILLGRRWRPKRGRPGRAEGAHWALLLHYAVAVNEVLGTSHQGRRLLRIETERVLDAMIAYEQRVARRRLTRLGMNNLITRAIDETDLGSLPEWALPVIFGRRRRGRLRDSIISVMDF